MDPGNNNGAPVPGGDASRLKKDYEWILDENLLRDEGVIYGISDSNHEEKTETIRKFYQEKIAGAQTRERLRREDLQGLLERKSDMEQHLSLLKQEIGELSVRLPDGPHQFFRLLSLFLAYTVMVGFTFGAIFEWLGPSWHFPMLVCVGVYVFGGLSLFHRASILYDADQTVFAQGERERWKAYLEEFGIPFTAVVFIVFWGSGGHSLVRTLSFGVMLYALFLFSGKGFLKALFALIQEFRQVRDSRLKRQYRKKLLEEKALKVQQTEQDLSDLGNEVDRLKTEIASLLGEAKQWEEEAETKVAYFLSEFALARATKDSLSADQLIKLGSYHNR